MVKRYRFRDALNAFYCYGGCDDDLTEAENAEELEAADGEWVRYEDYENLALACEWAGYAQGQGSGPMGSGNDGRIFGRCPLCRGVEPSKWSKVEFIESSIGHKKSCPFYKETD